MSIHRKIGSLVRSEK